MSFFLLYIFILIQNQLIDCVQYSIEGSHYRDEGCQLRSSQDNHVCEFCYNGYIKTKLGECIYDQRYCNQVSQLICTIPYCLVEVSIQITTNSVPKSHLCKQCIHPFSLNQGLCQYYCKTSKRFTDNKASCIRITQCSLDSCEECATNNQLMSYCRKCRNGFLELSGTCVKQEECSEGYFQEDIHCLPCQSGCLACTSKDSCLIQDNQTSLSLRTPPKPKRLLDQNFICDRDCFLALKIYFDQNPVELIGVIQNDQISTEYFLNVQFSDYLNKDYTILVEIDSFSYLAYMGLGVRAKYSWIGYNPFPQHCDYCYVFVSLFYKGILASFEIGIVRYFTNRYGNLDHNSNDWFVKAYPVCETCDIPQYQIAPSDLELICGPEEFCDKTNIFSLNSRQIQLRIKMKKSNLKQSMFMMHSIRFQEYSFTEEKLIEKFFIPFHLEDSIQENKIIALITLFFDEKTAGNISITLWSRWAEENAGTHSMKVIYAQQNFTYNLIALNNQIHFYNKILAENIGLLISVLVISMLIGIMCGFDQFNQMQTKRQIKLKQYQTSLKRNKNDYQQINSDQRLSALNNFQ